MVIAGLAAQGVTEIDSIHHIERGYETLVEKLAAVGRPDPDRHRA